jgi:acetoacetate decarboxylase
MIMTLKTSFLVLLFFLFGLCSFGNAQNLEKAFSMPRLSPLYPPPPIQYRDNRILTIIFKSTPEVLQKLVPKPLVPNPLNLMFIYVSELNIEVTENERYPYLEMGIGVPATYSKTLGNYAVYLYLDKALPIVGGREVWGWPKKDALINFVENDGTITASLERNGFPIISINASLINKVEPIPKTPNMPWYNLKIIPSVEKDALPEVLQLTSTINKEQKVKEYHICEAELEFKSSPYDPLGDIEILEITDVSFQVSDFVMDYGKIIYDYLAEKKIKE